MSPTKFDFFMFFLDEPGVEIEIYEDASDVSEFGRNWTLNTPIDQRIRKVKEHLGIEGAKIVRMTRGSDVLNVGADMMSPQMVKRLSEPGFRYGTGKGNQAGAAVEGEIPELKEQLKKAATQTEIMIRYVQLTQSDMSHQNRGREFEKLWRDVLDSYGWRTKKFRISGEENDFTAIYQGLHILGEVRWHSEPMDGGKMREFLAKLDPRPQTIGMFISYSGVDDGARSVIRRSVNTKTVIIFDSEDIEKVILQLGNPGPIFDEKLREAYDYLFEIPEEGQER